MIDGNNVFGSRPDGWWNDRRSAAARFAQEVAQWCRTHDDRVTVVFDQPVDEHTMMVAGGNLRIEIARRRGRDAADDRIVELVAASDSGEGTAINVVTSDRRLRQRILDANASGSIRLIGAGRFLELVD